MSALIRKPVLTTIGLVVLLFVGFLAGPRVEVDTTIHPMILPADLEKYVEVSEARFADIIPGTDKTIVWAGEVGVQTSLSIVYLHGFSASRKETAPLSEHVAMRLEANLYCTRFTGHGRRGDAMMEGSVNAWLNDTNEAIEIGRRLGKKVVVIGVSTGGTAATWLATQPIAEDVAAFVLISPNFAPADRMSRLLLWPWGGHLAELLIGPERSWEPYNAHHKKYWTHRYPTRALLPMMGLVELIESLNLSTMTTPTLVIYSPSDQVVSVSAIKRMVATIGATKKQLIPYTDAEDPSQHVLAGEILSPRSTEVIVKAIVDFVTK